MTSISSIARHAFKIVGPKDDFLTAIKTKRKSSGTLSPADRSRIISKFSQCTLRNGDIKLARTLLDTAQKQVSGMAQSNAQRSLQTVLNHCKDLTALAENADGAKPEHHLDASLASTRARLIQKDMSLAEAFACKLENKEVSFRTWSLLNSIFEKQLKHINSGERRTALQKEITAIRAAVGQMKECAAKQDLMNWAEGFDRALSETWFQPTLDRSVDFGFDPTGQQVAEALDSASECSSDTTSINSWVFGRAGQPPARRGSEAPETASEPGNRPDAFPDAPLVQPSPIELYVMRKLPTAEDRDMTLMDAFSMKFTEDQLTPEWRDKMDEIFLKRCQIAEYCDESETARVAGLLGDPDAPGFVNLPDATKVINQVYNMLLKMDDETVQEALEDKYTQWNDTIKTVTHWWNGQLAELTELKALSPLELEHGMEGCKWLGMSPDQFSKAINRAQGGVTPADDADDEILWSEDDFLPSDDEGDTLSNAAARSEHGSQAQGERDIPGEYSPSTNAPPSLLQIQPQPQPSTSQGLKGDPVAERSELSNAVQSRLNSLFAQH